MTSTLFWVLVVITAVVVLYVMCGDKKVGDFMKAFTSTNKCPQQPAAQPIPQLKLARRHATLTVEHNEPLLGSLFSREIEVLPDGISREEFERAVVEYQNQHLKEVEVKIPRSMNFNYEKYDAEQEAMRRNVGAVASQFTQRADVGAISEKLAKGEPVLPPQTLAPRGFLKKSVAKRR